MHSLCNKYKNTMNMYINMCKRNNENILRTLQSKYPKDY